MLDRKGLYQAFGNGNLYNNDFRNVNLVFRPPRTDQQFPSVALGHSATFFGH
jgi:hypothetical protein